jgi:hypothetical protein
MLASAPAEVSKFEKFAASSPDDLTRLNYTGLTYFLDSIVIDVGLSSRSAGDQGALMTGSRIPRGSKAASLLETNRIDFSGLTDAHKAQLTRYRQILEQLPSQRSLSRFNKNEQLAYWINLHNVALIEMLSGSYGARMTDRIKIDTPEGQAPLYDAEVLVVEGVRLSLNDIRVNIVYRYWSEKPEVIYGFYSGDLGGPSIIPRAYTGTLVDSYLRRNAIEFVNSKRGVQDFFSTLYVSPFYYDHQQIFFPDWPDDLLAHLRQFARSEVSDMLVNAKTVKALSYETELASVPSDSVIAGPGAPATDAVSRDATSAQVFGADSAFGPAEDTVTDVNGADYASEGRAASGVRNLGGEFFRRVQEKKRRDPKDFWPDLEERSRGRVTIEDVRIEDPDQ